MHVCGRGLLKTLTALQLRCIDWSSSSQASLDRRHGMIAQVGPESFPFPIDTSALRLDNSSTATSAAKPSSSGGSTVITPVDGSTIIGSTHQEAGAMEAADSNAAVPQQDGSLQAAGGMQADGRMLRVVLARRPGSARRTVLNAEEVLRWCNAWKPAQERQSAGQAVQRGTSVRKQSRLLKRQPVGISDETSGTVGTRHGEGSPGRGRRRGLQRKPRADSGSSSGAATRGHDFEVSAEARGRVSGEGGGGGVLFGGSGEEGGRRLGGTGSTYSVATDGPQLGGAGSKISISAARRHLLGSGEEAEGGGGGAAGSGVRGSGNKGGGGGYVGARCVGYDFEDLLLSAALMRQSDVLLVVHGATVLNAAFMPLGASVIEVRDEAGATSVSLGPG